MVKRNGLRFGKPSPALVVASIALFVALSGGATAGTYIATKHLQAQQLRLQQVRASTFANVLAGKMLRGTRPLGAAAPGKCCPGPRGPRGPRGFPGPAGPAGAAGSFTTANLAQVAGGVVHLCPLGGGSCAVGSSTATCPTGKAVLGGGWIGESADPPVAATVAYNGPTGASSWGVLMVNDTSALTASFHAVAVCAG
jgi:hypothetical protein